MTAGPLCNRISRFGYTLLGNGFAIDARAHKVVSLSARQKAIRWVPDTPRDLMIECPARVGDYLSILQHGDYSFLMNDGGVIQIAFTYSGREIESHRLMYYPCPFQFENRELNEFDGGLYDLLNEVYMNDLEANMLLRSPIRFDFGTSATSDFHPASHLTVNDPSCRVPARAPLHFYTFMKFVLENFYLDVWKSSAIFREFVFAQETESLTTHDRGRAYLRWDYGAPGP